MSGGVKYLHRLLARPTNVFVSASRLLHRRDGVVFVGSLWLNEKIFVHSQFVRRVNWVYLPAGIRLLSTLLLGADGALGMLLASWVLNFYYFLPNGPVRSFIDGFIATAAPYTVYRQGRETYGLNASLSI
ncbi:MULTISPECIES: hypothetical protein [unclassified Caballeronia]|uniref:hypothetical protein n=1 Tax=unclassified Caballeronia TaxID=2646786 RepID=UPI00202775B1|nr:MULTISPECIES: hypothetical protein [unclassified Caballeronia]